MKKPSQFIPLLKQMLGLYRFGSLPILFWFLCSGIGLCCGDVFFPIQWMRGHDHAGFMDALVVTAVFLWFFLMIVSTPLPFQVLGGISSLEFMFTRALDRAIWLRAERVAVLLLTIGPLLINLALSPWESKLVFDPAEPGSPTAALQQRYMNAFPGSQITVLKMTEPPQMVIRHGTEMFAVWLIWAALMGIFLVAGYFTWSFTLWQRWGWHHSKSKWRPWLGGAMVLAPSFLVIPLFIFELSRRVNIYEESFLLFARHPLPLVAGLAALVAVVQPLSERNIRKLEFEFF